LYQWYNENMNVQAQIVDRVIAKEIEKKKKRARPPPTPSHIPSTTFKKDLSLNPPPPSPTQVATIQSKKFPVRLDDPELEFMRISEPHRQFLNEYFRTGSATEAALATYDCRDRYSATHLGTAILSQLKIPVAAILDAHGINLGTLSQTIREAQKATKYVKSGSDKFKKIPDHNIRLKAASLVGNWAGITPQPTSNTNVQVNNIINDAKKKYDI
jgi:hypothetical protein